MENKDDMLKSRKTAKVIERGNQIQTALGSARLVIGFAVLNGTSFVDIPHPLANENAPAGKARLHLRRVQILSRHTARRMKSILRAIGKV